MKTVAKLPSSLLGTDSLSFTRLQRKRHPVGSFGECMGWIELAAPAQGRSRSPPMAAVCPFTTAFPAAPKDPQASPANGDCRVVQTPLHTKQHRLSALKELMLVSPLVGGTDAHPWSTGSSVQNLRAASFRRALGRRQFKVPSSPLAAGVLFYS